MHPIFDLVFRSASDESNTLHNSNSDIATGQELFDTSDTSATTSAVVGNNQTIETETLDSPLSLLDEFQLILQKYSSLLVKLHYDAAADVISSFLAKYRRQELGYPNVICQILIVLIGLEKQYYSLSFIRGKTRGRDDGDIVKQYEQIKKRVFEVTMERSFYSCSEHLDVVKDVLLNLISSRIVLIKVFSSLLSLDGWDQKEQIVQLIADINSCRTNLEEQQHKNCCLSEAISSVYSETCILHSLLNLQLTIVGGQYYFSLLQLKDVNERIRIWFNTVEYGKIRTKGSSFLRLSISRAPSIYLCGFIEQVYSLLFAKFSLYFCYNLSPYIQKTDFEQALSDIGPPNFNQLFSAFYRKNDVLYVAFLSTVDFGDTKSDMAGNFKVLYCLGGDRKQLMRLLPVALNVIVEKNVPKKVLQLHDGNTVHDCLISLIEGNVYMLILTNKSRKINNGKYMAFMTDVSKILTFSKLCQSITGQ